MTELLVVVTVVGPIASLVLGWVLQHMREHPYLYDCRHCRTEVRSRWEIRRCPACTEPYAR
jgi:Zn finger protein HypA/HybF involved in hydrogenase expression